MAKLHPAFALLPISYQSAGAFNRIVSLLPAWGRLVGVRRDAIVADGAFSGEGNYRNSGLTYTLDGRITGDAATGTLKEEWAAGGTICTTYGLAWEATRQK